MTKLESSGIVLGIDDSYTYENQLTDFHEGDIILIGTDGIFETRNSDNQVFGQDRVREIITLFKEQTAATIENAIVSEVKSFRGDVSQEDDITLVVIKADQEIS